MTRRTTNQNLTLYHESTYLGLPIQADKGPFILEYLNTLHLTMTRTIGQYKRALAFRFDLRLPADQHSNNLSNDNAIISRFIDSFKAKIRHNRELASRENRYAHDSVVRYTWARETGEHGRAHYHCTILLNYDAFCALGTFEVGRENMFNRLQDAWASALGLSASAVVGLVEIPKNARYQIHRDDADSFARFFYRASYLCKAATKVFGYGYHGFGASRI